MTNREKVAAIFKAPHDFSQAPPIEWLVYYQQTLDRWKTEGLDPQFQDMKEYERFRSADLNARFDLTPMLSQHISPYVTYIKPGCGEPCFDGTMDGYEKICKHLYPEMPLSRDVLEDVDHRRKQMDGIVVFEIEGFFWFPRDLFGIEEHLFAFHDQTEVMHRINSDLLAFNIRSIEQTAALCRPDYFTIAEDISFNLGPMISKEMFDEFLKPYYLKLISSIKNLGVPVVVDTDGRIDEVVNWYLDVGVDGIQPLERMAGVDVNALRQTHPDLVMLGGFDKTVLHKGTAAIDAEFERIRPAYEAGGYIPSMDHQTPPECSLETYRIYCRKLVEFVNSVIMKNGKTA